MRSRSLLACLLLLLAPLTGCAAPAAVPDGPIAFETIDQGPNSGIEERRTVAVHNWSAWSDLWLEHKSNEGGSPAIPNVDFNESAVLAIFKGTSSNGCHGAEITDVTGQNGTIHVDGAFYEVTGRPCTEQITHPFHIVEIDSYDAPVRFAIDEETRPADGGDQGGDSSDGDQPDRNQTDGNETDEDTSEPEPGPGDQGTYTCREPTNRTASGSSGSNVSFERIDQGGQSGIQEPCVTVARNETAWKDLWRNHTRKQMDPDPRPEVNFTENVVVAIFKGQSSDSCHGAQIEEITENGTGLVVHGLFVERVGGFCAEVITYPFDIVKTQRPEGQITFDVEDEQRQV